METPTEVGVCQRTLQAERRPWPDHGSLRGAGLRQVRPGRLRPEASREGDRCQLRSACGARSALESVVVVVDGELVVLEVLLGAV